MLAAWASLLIRSGLILGAAELLCRASKRSHPAYRHRLTAAGFVLLLLWPVFSAFLPEMSLPFWRHQSGAVVTVSQTLRLVGPTAPHVRTVNWPLTIWITGFCIGLLPWLFGHLKLRRILVQSSQLVDPEWQSLLSEECSRLGLRNHPDLLVCNRSIVPLVFGLFHPRILLPSECAHWQPFRRRAVLLHELMHIHRRDLFWQSFANFTSALWWFQPLCWLGRRRLRAESEQACDAWVVSCGIRASDYADELLGIAQCCQRAQSIAPATAMVRSSGDLESRLRAMFAPHAQERRRFRLVKVLALIALTLTASAVTLFPQENDFQGGLTMKRTLISGLLTSAGLTAATISGSVYDPSGTAVSNAQAVLYNPDTGLKQQAVTTPEGKFSFESLPAGSYILHIDKPGFASLYREFNVQPDSDVSRGLVLKTSAERSGATPNGSQQQPGVIRVGGESEQAKLVTKVQPIYPAAAKAAGIQGTVELDVTISKDGVPEDIRVVSSPSDELTESALEAVRQWRYSTTLLNGQPVSVVTDVIVNYTLAK